MGIAASKVGSKLRVFLRRFAWRRDKVKIATVIPELVRGGGEKLARQLHQFFLERGLEAQLFTLLNGAPGHATIHSLGGAHPKDPRAIIGLRAHLRRFNPDIVHSHMMPAQLATRLVSSSGRWRNVTTEHSTFNRRRGKHWGYAFDRWLYGKTDAICCISAGVRSAFCEWLPEYGGRLRQVNNGIEVGLFRYEVAPPPELRFVSVGRLEKVKGITTALRALAACKDSIAFTYTVFGEGPLRADLEREAAELGIRERVTFAGWSDRLHADLSTYSALLMPSAWEGFGLAAVEAMAAGVPVIGSGVDGLREVIGAAGFTFQVGDMTSLRDIICRYSKLSPDDMAGFRRRARERALQYDINNTVEGYLSVYREVFQDA